MTDARPIGDNLPYPSAWRAHGMLAILVVAYVISFIDRQILALMVGPVQASLSLSDFQISLLQGLAFAIFYCGMGLPLGRLADRMNRTRIIAAGIVIWSLATIGCGLSASFGQMFLARLLVGAGEAALFPAGVSLLIDLYPPKRQVRALSIFVMGGVIGAGLAYLVGGAVIALVSSDGFAGSFLPSLEPWQKIFVIVGLPGIVVGAVLLLFPEPARRNVAKEGQVKLSAALSYLWARRRDLGPYFSAGACLSILTFTGQVWFATHLIRNFGMSPAQVGLALGTIQLISGPLGGALGVWLTERFAAQGRPDAHIRTVGIATVLSLFTIGAGFGTDLGWVLACWVVAVVGHCSYYGTITGAIQAKLPNQYRAVSAAVLLIVMTITGMAVGTGIVGAISDIFFAGNPRAIGFSLGLACAPAAVVAMYIVIRTMLRIRHDSRTAAAASDAT